MCCWLQDMSGGWILGPGPLVSRLAGTLRNVWVRKDLGVGLVDVDVDWLTEEATTALRILVRSRRVASSLLIHCPPRNSRRNVDNSQRTWHPRSNS